MSLASTDDELVQMILVDQAWHQVQERWARRHTAIRLGALSTACFVGGLFVHHHFLVSVLLWSIALLILCTPATSAASILRAIKHEPTCLYRAEIYQLNRENIAEHQPAIITRKEFS